jgi:hypothetical protein
LIDADRLTPNRQSKPFPGDLPSQITRMLKTRVAADPRGTPTG